MNIRAMQESEVAALDSEAQIVWFCVVVCLIQVTKLVLENSLETRILDMQEKEAAYSAWAKNGCVSAQKCLVFLGRIGFGV